MDRDDVIQRIIDEKGIEAIPQLIQIMENEDPDTRELARDTIEAFGMEAREIIFDEFKKRYSMNYYDDVVILYLIDVLTELECMEIIPYLEQMLASFSDERATPLLLESLLRLTRDEKYLDILSAYLDEEDTEMLELAVMAMAHFPTMKTLELFIKKHNEIKDKSFKAFMQDSILKVVVSNPELIPFLQEKSPDIWKNIEWMAKEEMED